jgi:Asp-tRNA(Asn)/Glu-tRNA(Gln) amidotransferase B subunit
MSATHRGDMYHIRAAMAVKPRGIILYESDPSGKTRALEDYLQMSAIVSGTPCLVVTWSREDLVNGPKKEPDFTNCTLNGAELATKTLEAIPISFISEGGATEVIAKNVNTVDQMNKVIEYMALPGHANERTELEKAFTQIVETNKLFQDVKKGLKTVLILFRDTGSFGGP